MREEQEEEERMRREREKIEGRLREEKNQVKAKEVFCLLVINITFIYITLIKYKFMLHLIHRAKMCCAYYVNFIITNSKHYM